MRIGFNFGPGSNKGCKALEHATTRIIKAIDASAIIQPYPSGYTDKHFDAFLCIGGDTSAYWDTSEFGITRNAIKKGVPTLGLGLDLSPRLGRYTAIPPVSLRHLALMDELFVRSNGSKKLLERYGIPSTTIPDLAWILDPEPIDYEVPDNTVAIAAYQSIENLESLVHSLVWELRTQGYNVIQLREAFRHVPMDGLELTPVAATWEQNITILSKCKALITTGFHAAICGYKAGIPVMTLPVQEKTYWLAEELNLPKPIPFAAIQSPRYICSELKRLIDNPPKIEIPSHENTIELIRGFFNEYIPSFIND